MESAPDLYFAELVALLGAVVGLVLYVVARLGAAGRWGSDERSGDLGPGGAYRATHSIELVHRQPPRRARVFAAVCLFVGTVAVALALGLELLVVRHRFVATEPSSNLPWERPSIFDIVVAAVVPCGLVVDALIAASGWSVVRRGALRRRGGLVFVVAMLVHILVAWAIGARPAPYTPWAILYELVGMGCVVVGWALAVMKPM